MFKNETNFITVDVVLEKFIGHEISLHAKASVLTCWKET